LIFENIFSENSEVFCTNNNSSQFRCHMNKLAVIVMTFSCIISHSVVANPDKCKLVVDRYIETLEKGLASKISYMEKGIIKSRIDYIDRVRSKSSDCDVIEYFPDMKRDNSEQQ